MTTTSELRERPSALVVDGDAQSAEHCRQVLEEDGFHCVAVERADDALTLVVQQQFDLLVCDVTMPAPGGLVLIDAAKRLERPPAILPVAALAQTDSFIEGLKAGGWSVVFKPIDAPQFSRTVAWCLRAHRASRLSPTQLEALFRISALANTESTLERVLDQVLELLIGLLGADTGSVMLASEPPGPRRLGLTASFGLKPDPRAGLVDFGKHVSGWVAENQRALRLVGSLDAYPQFRGISSNAAVAESLVAPIVFRKQCLGVVNLNARSSPRMGQDSLPLLMAAADTLGAVIDRRASERSREHQDRLALLGRLAASIAHELRNPLAHLRSTLDYVWTEALEKSSPSEDIRSAFTEMREGVARMAELTEHLRGTSRKPTTGGEWIDPNELVMRTKVLVLPQLKHLVSLEFEPGQVSDVRAEGNRILQILINLVMNAAQAIGQQGREGRIVVRTREESGHLLFDVTDNGPGIPAEVAAHIFQPFFTTKGEGEGTGLGLSISRQIAREHGGELAFISTPGSGTTFTLRLPVTRKRNRPSVLVVDDEVQLLAALKRVLGSTFEVLTSTSAEEALATLSVRPVDLLITDLRMPGASGIELVRALRARAVSVPAVVLTASPDDATIREALVGNLVQAVVAKPWNATYLVGQLLELMDA